ncbi:MAG: hypothetical protein LBU65_03040, partial [Planctomycetaceae bacterium]|nr:hypothetical protein [Planctomycetaceae bacterium]
MFKVFLRLLIAAFIMSASLSAIADCGKLRPIPRPPHRSCPPRVTVWERTLIVTEKWTKIDRFGGGGYYDSGLGGGGYDDYYGGSIDYDAAASVPAAAASQENFVGLQDGTVQRPGISSQYQDGISYGSNIFRESDQQGVIAWNGKEEILVLSTNEEATKGNSGAMISVMPLPGKPIKIQRANKEIFNRATELLKKRMDIEGIEYGLFMKTEIGAHKIFVWKLDNIIKFEDEINAFIAETYGKNFSVAFDSKTKKAIQSYFDQGFQYFAFDLTMVNGKGVSTKEAIAYHFESKFAFFPTVISASGGTGNTRIRLAVFTSGDIKTFSGLKPGDGTGDYEIYVPGKGTQKSVSVSSEELRGLDPSIQ